MTEKLTYRELEQRIRELEKTEFELKASQKALKESEDRYRSVVEDLPLLICSYLPGGEITFVNRAYCKYFDTTFEALKGSNFLSLIPEVDQQAVMDNISSLTVQKQTQSHEHPVIGPADEIRWQRWTNRALFNAQGDIISYQSIGEDITEYKRAEKDLVESEKKYRTLVEGVPDLIYSYSTIRGGIYYSLNVESILGYSESHLLKNPHLWRNSIHPEDSHHVAAAIRDFHCGRPFEIEYRIKDSKGNWIWLLDRSIGMKKESGGELVIEGIASDITKRKQTEIALRESEQKWRNILVETPQIGISLDRQAKIVFANKRFLELTGWRAEEVLHRNWFDLFIPEDVRGEIRALFIKVMHARDETGYSTYENEILTKSGERLNIAWSNVLTKAPDGTIIDVTCLGIDLTDRQRAEKEREKLQAQLIQAQKMEAIGTLAGGIAHNFNNILMGIQGRTSLMKMDKEPSDSDYEHLRGIEEYVKNAVELNKDLLGFARGGKYQVKPTNLNALIRQENKLFGRTKKEIRIHGKYEKNLWTVEVDQIQVKQALLNLYVNAWQAMPGGGDLYIQTKNVSLDEAYTRPFENDPGRYVKVSVTDNGVGMDAATRKKIFDPFFSTKKPGEGSGLGLASLYGIITNHGGFINVYSEKGEGTTFNIYLPASKKDIMKETPQPGIYKIKYGEETVLLVDDEKMVLEVGQAMLEKLGYRTLTAGSGKEALDLYEQQKDEIDLVILDMIMPVMGGGETYDRLKAIGGDAGVLLSSGYSINGQAEEILDRGCNGFIQKPFAMEELSRKIREILDQDN